MFSSNPFVFSQFGIFFGCHIGELKIVYNLAEFGGVQNRKRVILFGVNKNIIKNPSQIVQNFYNNLDRQITKSYNVFHAIKDLPKIFPIKNSL